MLPLILVLTMPAQAETPSYMDLFSDAQPDPAPTPAPAPASAPPAAPVVQEAAVEAVTQEVPPAPSVVPTEGCIEFTEEPPMQPVVSEPASPWRIQGTAGLTVASHYYFRGTNTFGVDQQSAGALIAPSLTFTSGPITFGWWGAFQGSGPQKESIVRSGSGHEQDLYVSVGHNLSDRLSISGGLLSYIYPWGRAKEAGTDVPVWLEPNVSLSADVGVSLGLYVAYAQGLQSGIAASSYGYINGSVGHSVPVAGSLAVNIGANAGAKAVRDPSQWTGNTLDATLTWGVSWNHGPLGIAPAGHLTWSNLPSVSAGEETSLWVGVDTSLAL